MRQQTVERDVEARPGEGKPRVHPLVPKLGLTDARKMKNKTIYECLRATARKLPEEPVLGTRPIGPDGQAGPYEWTTYGEAMEEISAIASGLAAMGLGKQANIGLYSKNRREWILAEQACFCRNLVTVPLYDTLGADAMGYIIEQTGVDTVFASGECAAKLVGMRGIKRVICFDDFKGDGSAFEVIHFGTLAERGGAAPVEDTPPAPEDLCTICYTSGSTGMPKGVQIPHYALLSAAAAVFDLNGVDKDTLEPISGRKRCSFPVEQGIKHFSYLPLAHIMERVFCFGLLMAGGRIGFYQGNPLKLLDDIQALNPHIFITVPRILNRMHDKIMATVREKSVFAQWLFRFAYEWKRANLVRSSRVAHWLWDALVFKPIRAKLGTDLQVIMSGSAPLSSEVMQFIRICFSTAVYEGYGQTETCAASFCTDNGDWATCGHVGVCSPSIEAKLVDIPEMGYTSSDAPQPRGEICIRGPSCFTGYYKDPEKTKEALDAEGWVHTGDVGTWDELGRLRIIDRKKNLFKLAQGEYVSPERVENILVQSPLIAQAFVYGSSLESCTVAVVFPDPEALAEAAANLGMAASPSLDVLRDDRIRELFVKEVASFGKAGKGLLTGIELPRAIHLDPELMGIENGLLTTTFKSRRAEIVQRYASVLPRLYALHHEDAASIQVLRD